MKKHPAKVLWGGKPRVPMIPKGFKDYDGDRFPNMFDCQPRNPRKQGIVEAIAATTGIYKTRPAKYIGRRVKEYRELQRKKEERQTTVLKRREKLASARASLEQAKTKITQAKMGRRRKIAEQVGLGMFEGGYIKGVIKKK